VLPDSDESTFGEACPDAIGVGADAAGRSEPGAGGATVLTPRYPRNSATHKAAVDTSARCMGSPTRDPVSHAMALLSLSPGTRDRTQRLPRRSGAHHCAPASVPASAAPSPDEPTLVRPRAAPSSSARRARSRARRGGTRASRRGQAQRRPQRDAAHLAQRLPDRRQRRRREPRDLGVVEAHDRQVLRDPQPRARAASMTPAARLVAGREDRGRRFGRSSTSAPRDDAVLVPEVTRAHVRVGHRRAARPPSRPGTRASAPGCRARGEADRRRRRSGGAPAPAGAASRRVRRRSSSSRRSSPGLRHVERVDDDEGQVGAGKGAEDPPR
jgi:hypothetical protein